MNHHEPKLRRANGLLTAKGVPVAALNDRNEYKHVRHHAYETSKPTKSNAAINPTIGLGTGANAANGNDNHKTNGSGNGTPHKRPRPSSLTLTVAGEWIQRGVKTLGGLGIGVGPWSTSTSSKRQSLPPASRSAETPGIPVQMPMPGKSAGAREEMTQQAAAAMAAAQQEVEVPQALQEGTWMTKVSGKNQKKMFLRLDPDIGHIIWHSKQPRIST